jgi:hypothetical protein
MSDFCPQTNPPSICSRASKTPVGKSGTDAWTFTATQVTQDSTGKVNGGKTTLYYSPSPGNYVPSATTTDGGKTWTYLKDSNDKFILGDDARRSLQEGALKSQTNRSIADGAKNAGIPDQQAKTLQLNQNTASTNAPEPGGDQQQVPTQEQFNVINNEIKLDPLEGTRKNYPDVRYPENLNPSNQDCIQFSILKYNPRTLSLKLEKNRRIPTGRNALGTITLPIPAGIGDKNSADWQDDTLDPLIAGFAGAASGFILGGVQGATDSAKSSIDALGTDTKSLEAFIAAKATEQAVGSGNILARQFGAVINPNLELLFNGPQLRDFTFNFRFTPRTEQEAKNVRTIIRYFKQAMAPKRSKSVLLLKTPHTFGIQYLSKNDQHPYLNKFKECALTNCSVSYTPDGTYMTYTDGSMTAYELSLTFNELEPIFDDDYGDEKEIKSIGF